MNYKSEHWTQSIQNCFKTKSLTFKIPQLDCGHRHMFCSIVLMNFHNLWTPWPTLRGVTVIALTNSWMEFHAQNNIKKHAFLMHTGHNGEHSAQISITFLIADSCFLWCSICSKFLFPSCKKDTLHPF